MSNCCGCRRRGTTYGWLAFWGLVLFLVVASNSNHQGLTDDPSQLSEVSVRREAEPMSVSCTPSKEQDKGMERLLSEMEEQGRRLPKI